MTFYTKYSHVAHFPTSVKRLELFSSKMQSPSSKIRSIVLTKVGFILDEGYFEVLGNPTPSCTGASTRLNLGLQWLIHTVFKYTQCLIHTVFQHTRCLMYTILCMIYYRTQNY